MSAKAGYGIINKHLGVTLSKDLSWNKHIENLATTAGKCLDILNALKYKLDRVTLEKLYVAFVRSKLEYSNIVWDNSSKQLCDLLDGVQYKAAKIISGAINRTSQKSGIKKWDGRPWRNADRGNAEELCKKQYTVKRLNICITLFQYLLVTNIML